MVKNQVKRSNIGQKNDSTDEADDDQEVSSGGGEGVVEAVAVDVDGEDDAADDVQQVVDGQVLRDGIVDGRRSGGGRIEPGGE